MNKILTLTVKMRIFIDFCCEKIPTSSHGSTSILGDYST